MRVVDFITVEGFKSIKRVTGLPLNPINILIGPNGAGKTNLIEAFSLLDRIRNGNLQEYVIRAGGANRILHFGSAITQEVTVGISCHEYMYRYEITLASTESDGLSPLSEYGYIDHPEFSGPMEVNFTPRGTEAALSRSTPSRRRLVRYVGYACPTSGQLAWTILSGRKRYRTDQETGKHQ